MNKIRSIKRILIALLLTGMSTATLADSSSTDCKDCYYANLVDASVSADSLKNNADRNDPFSLGEPMDVIMDTEEVVESYTSLPEHIPGFGERVFIFSPRLLKWAAYDSEGYLVAGGKANGGASFCNELGRPCFTPIGSFRVYRKGDQSCVSNRFPLGEGGAPMPYCMFFNGGNAIHGSPYISNRNTSHGCIRVHPQAAAWLNRYFMRPGTKVVVLPY